MPPLPEKILTPEDEELQRKKASLAELELHLADRELELATLLADLVHFETRYLQTVGRRYALLDELKAKIAEARAQQNLGKLLTPVASANSQRFGRTFGDDLP